MPDPAEIFSRRKRQVARGPVTMEAKVGGSQMRGFFTIFPIWSMEVPSPWARSPPVPFSRKLKMAKPIIWAQQPAVAAPPASPSKFSMMQIAALLIGRVRAMPIRADTRMPMKKGCSSVLVFTRSPKAVIKAEMPGPTNWAANTPLMMVTPGVTRMSTRVSLEISLPSSVPMMVEMRAPTGPPRALPAMPTVAAEKRTSCGAFRAWAMEMPRAAPVALLQYSAIVLNRAIWVFSPRVPKMVPMSRDANRPKAMAPSASMR